MTQTVNHLATDPTGPAPSKAEQAYRTLRDRLVMLDVRPGSPLNEEQLSASLQVGRTPLREALKRLEHERLVASYPRRGTFATEVNITDLAHVSEVRRELEPVAAAAAASRATAAERARFAETADVLAATTSEGQDPGDLMRLDLGLHRALYAATHNPFLEDTLVHYDNLATRIWCLFVDRLPGMAGHVGEHGPLLRAIVDGDAPLASRLASDHVAGFEQQVRRLL